MSEVAKARVAAAFDRAAASYDAIARFQKQIAERLFERLPELAPSLRDPGRILDGGCGTGYGADLLRRRWPHAFLAGCDLSQDMLAVAMRRRVECACGDLENLPFAAESFGLIWSSLALQWCRPRPAFAELHRALLPGAALLFSTLAPGTLHEIGRAFDGIDRHRHVLPFVSVEELRRELAAAGFVDIRLSEETWITRHEDLPTLLASIRGIGANQIGEARRRGMLGKEAWRKAQARFEAMRDEAGRLPATYRVVFAGAVRP